MSRKDPKDWSLRSKISAACVVAECSLGDIDAAKKIARENEMAFQEDKVVLAIVDALVLQKRYDEAATFPAQESEWGMELANSAPQRHPNVQYAISLFQSSHRTASAACRVASAQFADGNREAALQTLGKAVTQIRKMSYRHPRDNAADIAIELDAIKRRQATQRVQVP